MTPLEIAQFVIAFLAIVGTVYGFYTGVLPRLIRSVIGFNELHSQVQCVKDDTEQLRDGHKTTIEEIHTLKNGQVALAEAIDDEHSSVNVDHLREQHFGEATESPDDFLRGGGESPYGDD